MKFILELWPDGEDLTPQDLVRYAIESVRSNGEALAWDVLDDDGRTLATDIVVGD